jgi:hypothetical protein
MPMRRAGRKRGLPAEEFVELTPEPSQASVGPAALFYADRAIANRMVVRFMNVLHDPNRWAYRAKLKQPSDAEGRHRRRAVCATPSCRVKRLLDAKEQVGSHALQYDDADSVSGHLIAIVAPLA